jgi:putative drug exporter of the RND superfamily
VFESLGRFTFRHRRAVIVAWLAIILLSAIAAPRVSGKLSHGASDVTGGEAAQGYAILERELGIRANTLVVVFRSESLRAGDTTYMDEIDAAFSHLANVENLDPPITYRSSGDPSLVSRDGHTTYALLGVKGNMYEATKLVPAVREKLQSQPDLTMAVTGNAAAFSDAEATAMKDMERAEKYTFPLIALVLVLVFGSLVAAGLPLAVGAASVVLTMGLVFLLSEVTQITSSSLSVIAFLGLGVGVDYSLIMVTRFREELRHGKGVEESLVATSATSGRAIFFSAITCVIGLTTMVTFDYPVIRSLGIGGSAVVLIALAAGLTLLPALMGSLGPRVNRLTLFHLSEEKGTFWQRLARWQMAHPLMVLVIILPILGLLIWPLAKVNPSNISYTQIPKETESRQGYDMLAGAFDAGEVAPILVCVTANGLITDWEHISALSDLTSRIASNSEVSRVESIVNLDPSVTREQYEMLYAYPASIPDPRLKAAVGQLTSQQATLVRVYTKTDPMGPEARELVATIRGLEIGGLNTYVTGPTAQDIDLVTGTYHRFMWVLLFIMVSSYAALFLLLRSVLLPLKAILLNVASVAATYGILVFMFQQGHFSGLLGFTADGTINFEVFVMLFCIVFGLSMDYEVFLLTRVKEEWDRTSDNTASVALGLARTGRVITSAALIMVVVFGTFVTGNLVSLKLIGLGLAISILLDATVIRLFLAPALMRIMGRWNWWAPSFAWRRPRIVKEPGRNVEGEVPVYTAECSPTGDAARARSKGSPT